MFILTFFGVHILMLLNLFNILRTQNQTFFCVNNKNFEVIKVKLQGTV